MQSGKTHARGTVDRATCVTHGDWKGDCIASEPVSSRSISFIHQLMVLPQVHLSETLLRLYPSG